MLQVPQPKPVTPQPCSHSFPVTVTKQETDCTIRDLKIPHDNQKIAKGRLGGAGITLLLRLEVVTPRENVMRAIPRAEATEEQSPRKPHTFYVPRKGGCRHLGPYHKRSVKPQRHTSLGTTAASHKKDQWGPWHRSQTISVNVTCCCAWGSSPTHLLN